LAGDLLEEFHSGRSAAWYWRQTLTAIAAGLFRHVVSHVGVLLFAALWSILAPSWFVFAYGVENNSGFLGQMWQMNFPWSTLCVLIVTLAVDLTFIWAGMALFLIPYQATTKRLSVRRIRRSLWLSVVAYIAASAGIFGLLSFLPPTHGIDQRTLTPLNAVVDTRLWAMAIRWPSFLTLVCALWNAPQPLDAGRKRIVA
jgi:amino acid transporter